MHRGSRVAGAAVALAVLTGMLTSCAQGAQDTRAKGSAAQARMAGGGARVHAAGKELRTLAAARGRKFGTAASEGPLAEEQGYQDKAQYEFNSLTPENAMKWSKVEPTKGAYDWSGADAIVDFATKQAKYKQVVRGHTLVWHKSIPDWVTTGGYTKSQLRTILKNHIQTMVKRYAGRVGTWDLVNEAIGDSGGKLRNGFWLKKLGSGYIADAFRWAHAADPNAELYINDYNAEADNTKSDALYALVKKLKADGVPIDGVGFQAHVTINNELPGFAANLKRFADLGVDVAITELDVRMPLPATSQKLATQADIYGKATSACLSVSRCVSINVWGFTDAHSWVPGSMDGWGAADLLDKRLQAKPAYTKVQRTLAK